MPTHLHLRAYLSLIAIFAVVAIVATLLSGTLSSTSTPAQTSLQNYPATLPPLTTTDSIGQQKGFQALVQYTASGFHPSALTVKKGDSVRFINTTATVMTLTITGASKQPLAHGAYYEDTFTKAGVFSFSDGVTKGSITVQ